MVTPRKGNNEGEVLEDNTSPIIEEVTTHTEEEIEEIKPEEDASDETEDVPEEKIEEEEEIIEEELPKEELPKEEFPQEIPPKEEPKTEPGKKISIDTETCKICLHVNWIGPDGHVYGISDIVEVSSKVAEDMINNKNATLA